ncbi:hypothetical protein [Candidatus Solirubrobacter pratensis]|uniref:hypothetical protein n=1 Tax=Candidatus Solirubrobacter pratensis TaxID=1298857 RepID=UPI00040D52E8|nr:hypothetical protein [Candidatus Solirubrobacter pratensis]
MEREPKKKMVNRNFGLRPDQVEWLREMSFIQRRPQTEYVREAIADLQAKLDADGPPDGT